MDGCCSWQFSSHSFLCSDHQVSSYFPSFRYWSEAHKLCAHNRGFFLCSYALTSSFFIFLIYSRLSQVAKIKTKTQRLFYMHNALSMLIKNGKNIYKLDIERSREFSSQRNKIYVQLTKTMSMFTYILCFCNFLKARSCLLLGTEFFMWKISQFSIACDDDK